MVPVSVVVKVEVKGKRKEEKVCGKCWVVKCFLGGVCLHIIGVLQVCPLLGCMEI